jgi:hypothetical protein
VVTLCTILLIAAVGRAAPPETVVVVSEDAGFARAVEDAFRAAGIRTVQAAPDAPPAIADLSSGSRRLADREHATAAVALVSGEDGAVRCACARAAARSWSGPASAGPIASRPRPPLPPRPRARPPSPPHHPRARRAPRRRPVPTTAQGLPRSEPRSGRRVPRSRRRSGSRRDRSAAARAYRAVANGDDAWAALALYCLAELEASSGRPRDALAAVEEYLQRFPRGAGIEDVLWIRVENLRALGRPDDARAAAAGYLRRFPDGTYVKPAARVAVPP